MKPGGQFIFVTWDKAEHNITLHISQQTVINFLKEVPPPFYARPYSMHDPLELHNHLTVAGFSRATIERISLYGECPSAMDAAIGFAEGNAIIHEILKYGMDFLNTIKAEIVKKINAQVGTDPIRSKLSAWVGEAFK